MKGWFAKLHVLFEWVLRLAYLNFLWIVFTLAGLGLFGIFPATATMFSMTREWLNKENLSPSLQSFWQTYRNSFVQTNILGIILLIIGIFIYIDFWFFIGLESNVFKVLGIFMAMVMIIYFIMLLYIFPIYVHYKLKTLDYIKYSFIYSIGRPINAFLMVVGVLSIIAILFIVPGFIPVFSGSGLSLLLMSIAKKTFSE